MRLRTACWLFGLTFVSVGLFTTSALAQQPSETGRKVVTRVTPHYPELARKMRISGTVKVEATVAPNGKVKSTKVIGGSPVLTQAALNAIEVWKWAPTASESKELIELTFHSDSSN